MAHKGFVCLEREKRMDENPIRQLQQAGVPRKDIFAEPQFRSEAKWLREGDYLKVCTLADLGCTMNVLLQNLAALCRRKVRVHSLEEPWCDLSAEGVQQLLQGFSGMLGTSYSRKGAAAHKKKRGRPPGITANTLAKCEVCERLLAETDRTQSDILASLQLSHPSWRRYLALNCQPVK